MKIAKKINNQIYKYPSEMVILTWLPQMIDFDILCLMCLMGDEELQFCNTKDYFEKLLQKSSILLKLSPDRQQICMAMQVLMTCQVAQHTQDLSEIIPMLVKTGMIDDGFCKVQKMMYVDHNESNIHVLVQIYVLAE